MYIIKVQDHKHKAIYKQYASNIFEAKSIGINLLHCKEYSTCHMHIIDSITYKLVMRLANEIRICDMTGELTKEDVMDYI